MATLALPDVSAYPSVEPSISSSSDSWEIIYHQLLQAKPDAQSNTEAIVEAIQNKWKLIVLHPTNEVKLTPATREMSATDTLQYLYSMFGPIYSQVVNSFLRTGDSRELMNIMTSTEFLMRVTGSWLTAMIETLEVIGWHARVQTQNEEQTFFQINTQELAMYLDTILQVAS